MNIIAKYKNMNVQVRAALWYTFCNFLQNGMAFILVPFYMYFLNSEEYGKWVTFQAWKDLLIVFASLNLYCGVYTKKLVDIKDNRDRYTSSMQGLGTTVTVIFFLLYLVFRRPIENYLEYNTLSIVMMFGYFVAFPSFQFWTTRQRVEYKYIRMVVVTIIASILTPVCTLGLLKYTDLKSYAIIYGYLFTQIVIGAFFYILHFVRSRTFYHKEYWNYALHFNIPLIPHYVSLIILGQSDRLMIKRFCSYSDAGVYGFGYQIASVMSVLISAINGSRVPWTYERLRDKIYDGLKNVTIYLCIMMGAIVLAVSLLSPEVVRILTITKAKFIVYHMAIYVIPIVALGLYFTFVYDLFCSIEFYYGKTKYIMVASCIGAVLNIGLNAIFIPMYGPVAAACTTLACYIVFMFMHYFFMRKICREEGIEGQVYNDRMIFLISALLSVMVLACIVTYQNNIIRFFILGALAIAVFLGRNKLISAVKTMKGK